MQGKMKSFFEDTGIILVLSATIFGGYYLYTTFTNDTINLSTTKQSQKEIIIKEDLVIDNNTSINFENVIIKEVVDKIEKMPEQIKVEKKDIVKITPASVVKEIEVKKEKNVDRETLRLFLRNIKFGMASNIVKRDDVNASVSQELKIRVTVLKDGNYEELVFVNGDKILFEMNRENILKVFPVQVDEKIKDDFPRYVRISIK